MTGATGAGELTVGREMDVAVAEQVFEATWSRADQELEPENLFEWLDPPQALNTTGALYWARKWDGTLDYFAEDLPAYSTKIAAAWQVVERFWQITVRHADGEIPRYSCAIYDRQGEGQAHGWGDTAPEAICRAALEAAERGLLRRAAREAVEDWEQACIAGTCRHRDCARERVAAKRAARAALNAVTS